MTRKAWREPSPSDWDRVEQLILDGRSFQDAALEVGGWTLTRLRQADPGRHAELKLLQHDHEAVEDRRTSRDTLRELAASTAVEPKDRIAAAERLGKASGYLGDGSHVQVDGRVEVDVSAGVERFTALAAAAVRALTGDGTRQVDGDADRGGEGAVGVPVERVDRAAIPASTSG